ncbi:MAG: hypothetical protein HDQ88_09300 [Clostridia bacterium]|nr:hypothetical protein [Clostridia bacterium]
MPGSSPAGPKNKKTVPLKNAKNTCVRTDCRRRVTQLLHNGTNRQACMDDKPAKSLTALILTPDEMTTYHDKKDKEHD